MRTRTRVIGPFGCAALVTIATFTPSSVVLACLGVPEIQRADKILLGATLFRVGLGLLGIVPAILPRLPLWRSAPTLQAHTPDPHHRWVMPALAAILLVATALRLYGINAGLWFDEIVTYSLYAKMPLGTILTSFESENQHFLYSVLAHGALVLFGDSAWALRLPAVLFGVGSIWALYLLGREVAGVGEALLASALLAGSYTHIWFSQNARGYSGLLFFATIASWLLLQAMRTYRPSRWMLYAVAAALGVYVHITMLFVIASHFAWYVVWLLRRRRRVSRERWAGLYLGFGLGGLLTFQLYSLVLPQVLSGMGREESVVAAWKNPVWTALEVVRGLEISFAGSAVAVGALAVFGVGFASYARTKPEVVYLLLVPAAVGAALVIGLGHHLWPRFFFFALGFAALVVIRGALAIGSRMTQLWRADLPGVSWLQVAPAAALVLVALASAPLAYGPKQDYLGAAAFVEANLLPGDAVATTGLAALPYQVYSYRGWQEVERQGELDSLRARAKRTWLVYTFAPVIEAVHPDLMATVRSEFQVVRMFKGTVGGGEVYVTRSDASPVAAAGAEESARDEQR